MAILVDKKTKVVIQGITGNEGSRAAKEMVRFGTKVLAGVTPGKGGQRMENIPVYDTIKEALKKFPAINTSLITVPGPFVKDAVLEALEAGIPLINILTEHVPTQDSALIVAYARIKGACIVGPSSVGIISPGKGKVGSVGSSEAAQVFTPGPIGIISKSGGMTAEIAATLSKAGFGQSTALGIGGDQIIGSDFADMLALFQDDPETKAVVMFGEVGGTYEEKAAQFIAKGGFTKPVVAMIAGKFSQKLPQETVLGHAGAIVAKGRGSFTSKIALLRKAGVLMPETLEDIPTLLSAKLNMQNAPLHLNV